MNEANPLEEAKDFLAMNSERGGSEAVMAQSINSPRDLLVEEARILKSQEEIALDKAEAALHKVIEAAAHNQATEKLFELKHEVKDERGMQHAASRSQTASIGQLLDSPRVQAYIREGDTTVPEADRTGYIRGVLTNNNLYAQAIRYGFAIALLSMLTAVLVVMLFTQIT